MPALIPWLFALAALTQNTAPPAAELRAALEALRDGVPGEPAFEAALPRLPELIRSRSDWFVAGGAYLAGKHGRRECIPELVDALDPAANLDKRGRESVLDALIRLDARVDPARLASAGDLEPQTFLLLARDAESNRDALLALHDALPDMARARWAVACVLADRKDPRIAERLLAASSWKIDVQVRLPGSTDSVQRGGCRRGLLMSHEIWPPRVVYHLELPRAGENASSIRFERLESGRRITWAPDLAQAERDELRARLLEELLGEASQRQQLQSDEGLVIDWSDVEAYRRELVSGLTDLRQRIGRVAVALESRSLLAGAGDVAARVTLEVTIHDLRGAGHAVLPQPVLRGVIYD